LPSAGTHRGDERWWAARFRTLIVRDGLYRRTAHLLGASIAAVLGSGAIEMVELVPFHHVRCGRWA
jgi:hypothetical protein